MTKKQAGFAPEEEQLQVEEVSTIDSKGFSIKKVELQDYPGTLPHGFFVRGERIQTFKLKGYSPEQDLHLGTLYSNQKADIKQILGSFLPTIIESVGSTTLKEIAQELSTTPQKVIERMPLADALTIVLNARMNNVGGAIALDEQCPNCKTRNQDAPEEGRPYHDLREVQIGLIPTIQDKLIVRVDLEQPFAVGEDMCRTLHMRPLRLYELQRISKVPRGKIPIAMAQFQVCGIPEASALQGVTGQIFDDEMYKEVIRNINDRKRFMAVSAKLQEIGPRMELPITCYNCSTEWDSALAWPNLSTFLFEAPEEIAEDF